MLSYWFWPNPGNTNYSDTTVLVGFAVCGALFLLSFVINFWRKKQGSALTKKLSRSWASALRWFSIIGVFLILSRVEDIQFLAMRVLWLVWGVAFVGFVLFQMWNFRRKHYTVVPKQFVADPRKEYLPR